MKQKLIKNISLFSNAGVGEYGTNNINLLFNNTQYKVKTVIANELLKERAEIYSENYPTTNMIVGSITDPDIQEMIVSEFKKELPQSGTFSPPCQGSSGLNAFKGNPYDFRNQLIKSVFKIFEEVKDNNSLEFGYIENVVSYYNEEIPVIFMDYNRPKKYQLTNEYITTKDNEILNYKCLILSNDESFLKEKFPNGTFYELIENNKFNYKYTIAFNTEYDFEYIVNHLKNTKNASITSMSIKNYIEQSMQKYGYKCELKTIRGEEYGAVQIRQRGFCVFYKDNLNIQFPIAPFNTSKKMVEYNGKTLLDAFKTMELIEVIPYDYKSILKLLETNMKFKIKGDTIYIDTAISSEEMKGELIKWDANNYSNNTIPNLHFYHELKPRYKKWVLNTTEGLSAYKNTQRIDRPYKLIKVLKDNNNFSIKSDNEFVVFEDSPQYFKDNKIIDYKNYVTDEMKKIEGLDEWGDGKRQWMLKNKQIRTNLEKTLIDIAKSEIKDNGDYRLIFFPIKGFEAATYKRNTLNKPINALTTKMNYGNSNTVHPIFDRLLTPAEVMAAFGLGYILNDNLEFTKINSYIPPKGITSLIRFQNLTYEIMGEAIISTVAEYILKDLLKQYLK